MLSPAVVILPEPSQMAVEVQSATGSIYSIITEAEILESQIRAVDLFKISLTSFISTSDVEVVETEVGMACAQLLGIDALEVSVVTSDEYLFIG